MIPTRTLTISRTDPLDPTQQLQPDDMMLSMGDIAFAGCALGGIHRDDEVRLGSQIASLAHVVTRIVLSRRLVFLDDLETDDAGRPTSFCRPQLIRHCHTLRIHQTHPLILPVIEETAGGPKAVFGGLYESVVTVAGRFTPTHPQTLATTWLAEYAAAKKLGAPLAPNPLISTPLALHEMRSVATSDIMLAYVKDLRRESSQELNLLSTLDIYDLNIPAIFAAVLREAKGPKDIIPLATQMNSEAKPFHEWCRTLDKTKAADVKKYLSRLNAARASLGRLGKALGNGEEERIQISNAGPVVFGVNVPAPTLKRVVDYFNVETGFFRPRSYLLNLLKSARQVERLSKEIARVFDLKEDFVRRATAHFAQNVEKT